jgi:hypothetical protein
VGGGGKEGYTREEEEEVGGGQMKKEGLEVGQRSSPRQRASAASSASGTDEVTPGPCAWIADSDCPSRSKGGIGVVLGCTVPRAPCSSRWLPGSGHGGVVRSLEFRQVSPEPATK